MRSVPAIKEDPELANIPVVLLVGTFEPFDEIEASRVKCDAYLTKPFDTSELHPVGAVACGGGCDGHPCRKSQWVALIQ